MRRPVIAILVLLTAVAALTSGALNGRVLCMAAAGHLAIEEPHHSAFGDEAHCCPTRAGAGSATPTDGDDRVAGDFAAVAAGHDPHGCVDLEAHGTLVRESAAPTFDNAHALLALPQFLHVPPPLALVEPARTADPSAGVPPALADLANLRVIVLVT